MDYHIIKISRNKKQYLDLLSVSYTHLTLPTTERV